MRFAKAVQTALLKAELRPFGNIRAAKAVRMK
jgi:hypothetical protein